MPPLTPRFHPLLSCQRLVFFGVSLINLIICLQDGLLNLGIMFPGGRELGGRTPSTSQVCRPIEIYILLEGLTAPSGGT